MKSKVLVILSFFILIVQISFAQEKLHVVLAGLTHDHVNGILEKNKNKELVIVGIAEANKELCTKKKTDWQLADSIFFSDVKSALKKTHPDLVMVFNAPAAHLTVAEFCLPLKIPVMYEKPLCYSYAEAKKMETLSKKFNTKIYTNYPSLWYKSFNGLLTKREETGGINKIVMRGGHRGPIEIGCSKDFTNWLTDSVKNGGGALIDFGCYGALMMTELMKGKLPVSVYANTKHLKPSVYPKVDDAATIVLEYKNATGIIEASWNWPYTIMDVELFGSSGYLHASEFNESIIKPSLQFRNETENKMVEMPQVKYGDEVAYLTDVIKNGSPEVIKMMSLEYNLVVVKILDAARKSAKEGEKVKL
jgi:predicted dehydrogenase